MELVTILTQKMKYISIVFLLFILSSLSCVNKEQIPVSKSRLIEFFKRLPKGTNVADIEKQLNLPEPKKRRAPAYGEEGWQFQYILNKQFLIYFNADFKGEDEAKKMLDSKYYIYLGKYHISTVSLPSKNKELEPALKK